jgi:NAD(P)-dependent dehydrogenase (short-subunit alcohol dehydrogenase family)
MRDIDKSALITGASSGIGRATVEAMLKAEWRVFATVRKVEDLEKLQSEGDRLLVPVLIDLDDPSTIPAALARVESELEDHGLDGLVNVAGIGMVRPLEYASQEDLHKIFEVNVFAQLAVIQTFLPLLRKARGRIVNITSVGAHIAIPFGGLLTASKSAFSLLNDTLRLELHPFGIHVCSIEPGSIKTPAVDKTLGDVEGVIRNLPERGAAQYGQMLRSFARRAYAREMKGSPPEVVARAVRHALTSTRPRIRYVVGKDARLLTTLSGILPDWLLDVARFRNLGLPSKFGVARG